MYFSDLNGFLFFPTLLFTIFARSLSQMMDKFNRVGNVWIDKLDSEVDSGNQICLMDYFNRAALASIVTVSTELPLTQKITTEDYCPR